MKDGTTRLARRAFLAGSASVAAGTMMLTEKDAQAQMTNIEEANVKLVNDFCAAWATMDLRNVTALMSEDAVYRMSESTPPVTGHAGLVEQMQSWVDSSSGIEFRVLETFAKGPLVVNHRVDRFESSTRPLTWEGVGVFFVQDSKIKEWLDYTIRVDRS